jgi:iron complex transport system substrate-binding protein
MKRMIAFLIAAAMCFCIAGCSAGKEVEEMETDTVVYTDDCGREVEIPAEISRIVATGPVAQIMLYTLAPDMLVGLAAKWSAGAEGIVPEEYLNLPYYGQLYNLSNLNIEELALAEPQLIIDIGRYVSGGAEAKVKATEWLEVGLMPRKHHAN